MSAWRKFVIFGPQFVGTGVACGLLSAAMWLDQHGHNIAMVPTIVGVAVASVVTLGTAINKVSLVCNSRDGWERVGAGCRDCAALTKDRDELRQALLAAREP